MDLSAHNEAFLQSLSNPEREEHARSILDLIELGTFDLDLAAWLVAQVAAGASFITGSGPGGIGKTTTMRTLLSFIEADRRFFLALPGQVNSLGDGPHCVVSNELSDHPPPTYLWGQDLRDFFALGAQGHTLVGNVHADDIDEVHGQIVTDNDVPEAQFRAVNLFIFICLEGGNPPGRRIKDDTTRRVVNKIFYSDGTTPHASVYDPATGLLPSAPHPPQEKAYRKFLEEALEKPDRSLEGVRRAYLAWEKTHK